MNIKMNYPYFLFIIFLLAGCVASERPSYYHINYQRNKAAKYGLKKVSIDPKKIIGFQVFFNNDLKTVEPNQNRVRVIDKIFILLKNGDIYYSYDVNRRSYLYKNYKIKDDTITYESDNGKFISNGFFQSGKNHLKAARIGFPIAVQPKGTKFVMKKTFKPSYYNLKNYSEKGNFGNMGSAGSSGSSGFGSGSDGSSGDDGSNGENGENGLDLEIEIKEFKSKFYKKTLVWIQIESSKGISHFLVHRDQKFSILTIGGDGGAGGNGGDGGDGQAGENKYCSGCNGGDGGDGGNGGDGGDGGKGGDGGQITINIKCSKHFYSLIQHNLSFVSLGGKGGRGGSAGSGGDGGIGGQGASGDKKNKIKPGNSGRDGQDGTSGSSGSDGDDGSGKNAITNYDFTNKVHQ